MEKFSRLRRAGARREFKKTFRLRRAGVDKGRIAGPEETKKSLSPAAGCLTCEQQSMLWFAICEPGFEPFQRQIKTIS
jgi:hypothetical protein